MRCYYIIGVNIVIMVVRIGKGLTNLCPKMDKIKCHMGSNPKHKGLV